VVYVAKIQIFLTLIKKAAVNLRIHKILQPLVFIWHFKDSLAFS